MKVIIPLAGAGRSLRPFTYNKPKPLIPVAGKPIIGHIIQKFVDEGLTDFVFITGYLAEKIEQYIHKTYRNKISYRFVRQRPRLGLAHAVSLTKKHLYSYTGEVVVALGDTIIDMNYERFLSASENVISVQKVENPSEFGIVNIGEDLRIFAITEKPPIPKSNIAVAGIYKFTSYADLLGACEEVQRRNLMYFGEYQLTDAISLLLRKGRTFYAYFVNHWFDCGRPDKLLETNRALLRRQNSLVLPEHKNGNIIRPPVYIPENCSIKNSIIGPYVSLGENVELENVLIRDSIVGSNSELRNLMLKDSVVGMHTQISSKWNTINLGDNAKLSLGN